jgi:hypothetical protein
MAVLQFGNIARAALRVYFFPYKMFVSLILFVYVEQLLEVVLTTLTCHITMKWIKLCTLEHMITIQLVPTSFLNCFSFKKIWRTID